MPLSPKQTKLKRFGKGQVDYVALSRDLVDAIESGVYIVQSRKFVYVNPFFTKLTGYARDELIGMRSFKLVLPADRTRVRKKAIRNLKSHVGSKPYEYRFIKKNGDIMWVMESVTPIEYMGKRAALGSFMDITGRKQLEEALAHSEETYRNILEQMYDSYYEVDLAGNFTFVNDSVCRNLGYSSEEMLNQCYRFTTPPGDIKPLLIAFSEVFRTGVPNTAFAHGILRKDGSIISVESSISLRQNEKGEIIGFRSVSRDVTERKKLEDELQKLASVVHHSSELINLSDTTGKMIFLNEAGAKMLGIDPQNVEQFNIMQVIPDHLQEKAQSELLPELLNEGKWEGDLQYRNLKTGQLTDVHAMTFAINDPATGAPLYLANVSLDITERKQAENALRENEERARTAMESAPDGIYINDLNGNFLYGNRRCEEIIGYKREELIGKNFLELDILPEDSLARAAEILQDNIKGKATGPDELALINRDGLRVPVEINTSIIQRGGEKVVLAFVRDITERKRVEAALKDSEERYGALFDRSLNLVYVRDLNGNFIDANPAALDLLGYRREEISTLNFASLLDPAQFPRTVQILKELTETGFQKEPAEFKLKRKDGSFLYVETQESVIYRDGKPHSVQGVGRDITGRKIAEAALQKSEEKYRSLVENINDVFYTLDTQGNITYVSPVVERLSQYRVSDLVGKPFVPLIYPDDLPGLMDSLNRLVSGELEPWEFRIVDKDGKIIFVRTSSRPVYEGGKVVGITALMTDITQRKLMEQKLEEMATHDFLTGLPNRVLLLDRFNIAAALARRNKARLAVMSLDLDRFKSINDTLGHDAGDQVLRGIGKRLTGIIRASDTLARVGGDEFVLVMLETSDEENAAAIAQKILNSFTEPFPIDGHLLQLSTSIGIAVYPEDAQDLETLTRKSDAAMYFAKGHGRNRFKFFKDGDVTIGRDHRSAP